MEDTQSHVDEPGHLPGWVCIAIGIGFIGFLAGGVLVVRLLAG